MMSHPKTVMVCPEGIPDELKTIPRWVCWKWEHDGQKWRKPPLSCRTGAKADINDQSTRGTFEEALAYHQDNKLDGIGLVMTGDGYCGVDLDNCHDLQSRQIEAWAADVINGLASYTEWSPSGTGCRVFVRSMLPSDGRKIGNIEVYRSKHYFTVTGCRLSNAPAAIESRQPELLGIYHERLGDEVSLTDDEVIGRARRAGNGDKFVALFDDGRKLTDYQSESEADLALAAILAFWTRGNPKRVETLFGRSALAKRKKWQRKDYRERTIQKALAGLVEFYQPRMLTSVARFIQAKPANSGYKNTDGKAVEQVLSDEIESSPGQESRRHKQDKSWGCERTVAVVVELAEEDANLPLWQASFRLARRLRKLTKTAPEQFEQAVRAYCLKSGRQFDELWYDFLVTWERVETAEGDDPLTWAVEMAKTEPYPLCSLGDLYSSIAGLAWHLSRLTAGKTFFLPRERLGELYGFSAMTISRVVTLLEKKNIIKRSDKEYSYVKGEAQEYTFTGPDPVKSAVA